MKDGLRRSEVWVFFLDAGGRSFGGWGALTDHPSSLDTRTFFLHPAGGSFGGWGVLKVELTSSAARVFPLDSAG